MLVRVSNIEPLSTYQINQSWLEITAGELMEYVKLVRCIQLFSSNNAAQ